LGVSPSYLSGMYRVAIVDDDGRVAWGLKEALMQFEEISSVSCGTSGLQFALELESTPEEKRPHVIIMDISMGSPDEGIVATQQIKAHFPEIEIIMFTISDEDEQIFEAFKAGAMGYLLKSESPDFILRTIIDVKNGGAQMSPSIARKTIRYLAPVAPVTKEPEEKKILEDTPLSVREREILDLVAKGFTYPYIADTLHIATHTVKKHMMNIFGKLHVKNKIEALKKIERLH
jgi:DNA-binding NarL/FixJ family response regulator